MQNSISQNPKDLIQKTQQKQRVLIVDDQWANRYLLRCLLESFPCEIHEAENGLQAVEMHLSWRPHLIWMDLSMPVMSGSKAVKLIRDVDSHTKIIAMSAFASEEDKQHMLNLGCDGFIAKPCRVVDVYYHTQQYLPKSCIAAS
ncbi:response regulator [Candidatus Uabimicrobium amorphum]|uniref:Histidine kinase n=1 Tax=Uabimicrobium amorphum TaxID=2596890 RepID=A0A5S9F3Q4_UABAM|nr:response regulator [Candidatus Uabimicrobium amorphum]BBM83412.1 histidine kinase [Candidatus Uabimicrobium amorphum]